MGSSEKALKLCKPLFFFYEIWKLFYLFKTVFYPFNYDSLKYIFFKQNMAFDGVLSKAFLKQQIGIFDFLSYIPQNYEHTLCIFSFKNVFFVNCFQSGWSFRKRSKYWFLKRNILYIQIYSVCLPKIVKLCLINKRKSLTSVTILIINSCK